MHIWVRETSYVNAQIQIFKQTVCQEMAYHFAEHACVHLPCLHLASLKEYISTTSKSEEIGLIFRPPAATTSGYPGGQFNSSIEISIDFSKEFSIEFC